MLKIARLVRSFGLLVVIVALPNAAWSRDVNAKDPASSERIQFLFDRQVKDPFPPPRQPDGSLRLIGVLNLAYAELRSEDPSLHDLANTQLADMLAKIPQMRSYTGVADSSQLIQRSGTFHFQIGQFLYKIYQAFGERGSSRLTASNAAAIKTVMASWAASHCTISDTSDANIWRVWGSENHQFQRDGVCWSSADLLRKDPKFDNFRYSDGSDAKSQFQAWTSFITKVLKSRLENALLVEYFSPTYARYSLSNIVLYADYSEDAELRKLSTSFLNLWWAMWAQEQIDGVHAGSKTRTYISTISNGSALSSTVWSFWGKGARPRNLPPGEMLLIDANYRPAAYVTDILNAGAQGPRSFDVYTRALGLAATPTQPGPVYELDATKNRIVRVTRVTPDYAMGAAILPLLPDRAWTAISSQNRWAGLVFAGGDSGARIVPEPRSRKNTYNNLLALQSGSTQITRLIRNDRRDSDLRMEVFFGEKLNKSVAGDWIFVESTGFAAVRPAFGGWKPDSDDPNWMVLNDPRSPVILHAGTKNEFGSLAAFISAVTAAEVKIGPSQITVFGLDKSLRLTMGLDADPTLQVNEKPFDFSPPAVVSGPFVYQAAGSGRVRITTPRGTEELDLE